MARQTERLGDARGNHRRAVADREHAVNGLIARNVEDRCDRRQLVMEVNRDGLVLPRIVEDVTTIGRKDELDAHTFRGLAERAGLIAGCGRQQQHS